MQPSAKWPCVAPAKAPGDNGRALPAVPTRGTRLFLLAGTSWHRAMGFSAKITNAGGRSPTSRGAAAMQEVADWLERLGLGQYAQRFAENDIDVSVLPDLTDESLKELGISLGHRLKILTAIKELSPPTPATPQLATPAKAKPHDTAERRQVTVMFSDLVGSTALSARMDPEDLREVISAYQKCVAETVQRFGGFVAKYMGDGVLVYFGYPQAHEDDAERAVRAGLELIEAVSGLNAATLHCKPVSALRPGLVVVGDLIGSGEAQERGIVGETPNLAARLQGIAEPNTVVIAESTRKLLGNLFELAGPRSKRSQRHRRASAGLCGITAKLGREPLRGFAHSDNAAGWSRRGDRASDAALGAGESWRRLCRPDLG